jgi:hypothetical protein
VSKVAAIADEAWKLLPVAADALSHALVHAQRTTFDGKVGYLVITNEERRQLLKGVEQRFETA